ncbi:hydroxyacylglutathione hydrolase [Cohaesibacter marisflavi]|uniref:Hydroxyacylglutathione hydrolase n=1 Tax=Cohaesibacter marisflavi TaxID=655353 RepID=A0A1I5IMI5_9HYPH|nr:hydroxyacylglutathione hydrolase [Cohaesibacter marisflavi]SFO61825.1 hydroxyacylglutathione hydrolase [Cohaesibacter marisflavi]
MTNQPLETKLIPCRSDNYAVLVHDKEANLTFLVDVPEAPAIRQALKETDWSLTHILITHHHYDHVEGLAAIKGETGATVYGPADSASKIGNIDEPLSDGDSFKFGDQKVYVLGTPGHTLDHISYWLPDAELAFTGDTLFAMGCGRVFEGTLKDMWFSVDKLAKLPPETTFFCGHEYTEANGNFCLSIEPDNELLQQRVEEVKSLRAQGLPTVPSTILDELTTNSFLRANDADVKASLGMADAEDWEVFAEIRTRKDNA